MLPARNAVICHVYHCGIWLTIMSYPFLCVIFALCVCVLCECLCLCMCNVCACVCMHVYVLCVHVCSYVRMCIVCMRMHVRVYVYCTHTNRSSHNLITTVTGEHIINHTYKHTGNNNIIVYECSKFNTQCRLVIIHYTNDPLFDY